MASPYQPLPAIRPIQATNPGDELGKMIEMKSMLQGQQLQQGQLQLQQQQLKDQQAMTAAMKNWDGKDYDSLSKSVLQNGGSANAATQIQQHGLTIKKTVSDIAAQDATTGSKNLETFIGKQKAVGDALQGIEGVPDEQLHDTAMQKVQSLMQNGILDPQTGQKALQGIQTTQDPKALRAQIDMFAKTSMGAKALAEQQKTQAETQKDTEQAGEAGSAAAKNRAESSFYAANPSAGAPGVPAATVSMMDYMRTPPKPGEPMHTPSNYPAWQAKQEATQTMPIKVRQAAAEAAATQPYKIQTAQAEAQATQLIKGMAEPGYAFNPQTGQTQLTDKTTYLQGKGQLQGFRPVGEKDIREDTMLTNRLADVHQKIAEYEQALQKPVSSKDQGNMASLLGTQQGKLGAFGTEIPLDRLNAALAKENLAGLSPTARDQIVAYKNAREAMMGYKTVLSGSARGSDKSMDLLTQALPDPSITDPDYSKRSLTAFKQNLHVVGQGLPTLPGIKNPQQIEAEVWGDKSGSQSKANDPLGIR